MHVQQDRPKLLTRQFVAFARFEDFMFCRSPVHTLFGRNLLRNFMHTIVGISRFIGQKVVRGLRPLDFVVVLLREHLIEVNFIVIKRGRNPRIMQRLTNDLRQIIT